MTAPVGAAGGQPPLVPAMGERPWVMGILNVTPDSFSDGGLWDSTDAAIAHGQALVAAGADIVDVGGESTRPGAHRVPQDVELDRVIDVIAALAADGVPCSVDTTRAAVAAAAVRAGAVIVNDVSAGLADAQMAATVADLGVPWVLMHWRGHSDAMQQRAEYADTLAEVRAELLARVDAAIAAGVDERALILDAGIGFAKNAEHNWELLAGQRELVELGLPVLLGTSRKRFLGQLLAGPDGAPRPVGSRDIATAATSLLAAQAGVWGVRVHDPQSTADVLAVLTATLAADPARSPAGWPPAPAPLQPATGDYRFGALAVPRG
nr:dihydropteroate synthase [Nakamurella aerolata]